MSTQLEPRNLQFDSLDNVIAEANRLLDSGYQQAGSWTLAQVCGHCGNWLRYPMDGFPKPPLPIAMMLWLMKKTMGKRTARTILESRSMPRGRPTMPESVPKPDEMDDRAAVAKLTETVERFKTFDGPWQPSPLFGDLDTETLTRLNLIHCAHHFSFLIPNESSKVTDQ